MIVDCLVNLVEYDPAANGGQARVAQELCKLLADYADQHNRSIVFAVNVYSCGKFAEWLGATRAITIPVIPMGEFSPLLASLRPKLLISPLLGMAPFEESRYPGVPHIVTIPDTLVFDLPEALPWQEVEHRLGLYRQMSRAAKLIAYSQQARSTLIRHLQVAPDQVAVIPLAGIDTKPASTALATLPVGVRTPYVFYPANGWPHKRHDLLIQIMLEVWKRQPRYKLILTGWHPPDLIPTLVKRYGCPADKVIDLGYVSDAEVKLLYQHAEALLFVSRFECFGMPLLEAMQNGCPAICAPVGAIPETVEDAALLVDSVDPARWADALLDQLPLIRASLVERGYRRAGSFTWERFQSEWVQLLDKFGLTKNGSSGTAIPSLDWPVDSMTGELSFWSAAYAAQFQQLVAKEQVIQDLARALAAKNELLTTIQQAAANTQSIVQDAGLLQDKDAILRAQAANVRRLRQLESRYKNLELAASIVKRALAFTRPIIKSYRAARSPKLGILHQYPPRPLRLPPRYKVSGAKRQQLPRIAIVTPSYNQGEYLEKTINSVLDQDYPYVEYVIQDGGSTDNTHHVLEAYHSRLTYVESAKDSGQADAINRGFVHTTAEIMAFLNADDLLLPGTLDYVGNYFRRHPGVDVVYGHRIIINADDGEIGRWVLPPHDPQVLSWADYIPQETLFWRRRLWEQCGGYVDETFQFALDWELILRFREAGALFVRLPRFLGAFRVHSEQKTSTKLNIVGQQEMFLLRERALHRQVQQSEVSRRVQPYLQRHCLYHALFRLRLVP